MWCPYVRMQGPTSQHHRGDCYKGTGDRTKAITRTPEYKCVPLRDAQSLKHCLNHCLNSHFTYSYNHGPWSKSDSDWSIYHHTHWHLKRSVSLCHSVWAKSLPFLIFRLKGGRASLCSLKIRFQNMGNRKLPFTSLASCIYLGSSALQWPHQGA